MNRICRLKSEGTILEMHSGGKIDRLPREKFETEEIYETYLQECDALEAERLNVMIRNNTNSGQYSADQLEVKWVTNEEFSAIRESLQPVPTYSELRRNEYPSTEEVIEALLEKYEENRPEKMTAIQARRMDIKEKYPKPE